MISGVRKYFESFYYLTLMYGKTRSYIQPYISTNFAIHEIVPNLYIGDFASACNAESLKKLGFTHIVTAILGVDPMYPDDFKYLTLPLRDVRRETIYPVFTKSSDFIKNAIQNEEGKVLVHCVCGVSRSATLVAAYLIREFGFDADKAIEFMQSKRSIVAPNSGFQDQLRRYDAEIRGDKLARRHSI